MEELDDLTLALHKAKDALTLGEGAITSNDQEILDRIEELSYTIDWFVSEDNAE